MGNHGEPKHVSGDDSSELRKMENEEQAKRMEKLNNYLRKLEELRKLGKEEKQNGEPQFMPNSKPPEQTEEERKVRQRMRERVAEYTSYGPHGVLTQGTIDQLAHEVVSQKRRNEFALSCMEARHARERDELRYYQDHGGGNPWVVAFKTVLNSEPTSREVELVAARLREIAKNHP